MIKYLFHYTGPHYGRKVDVDAAYTPAFIDVPVVYCNLFERNDLDTLQLMHGRTIKMTSVWDWFDEVWDKVHDRTQQFTLAQCFENILSSQGDLPKEIHRMDYHAMQRRKKHALEAYERRNDPPIYFIPPKEFLA